MEENETGSEDEYSLVFDSDNFQPIDQPDISKTASPSLTTESLSEETKNSPTVISNHIRKKALEFSQKSKSDSLISPILNNRIQNRGKRDSPVIRYLWCNDCRQKS